MSKSGPVNAQIDAHEKLERAGFLFQAHSGIFHLLPLAHRVQHKIEALVDKHMRMIGDSARSGTFRGHQTNT